jgi:hypothetical protein
LERRTEAGAGTETETETEAEMVRERETETETETEKTRVSNKKETLGTYKGAPVGEGGGCVCVEVCASRRGGRLCLCGSVVLVYNSTLRRNSHLSESDR